MVTPSKRSPVGPGQMLAGKYRVEREIGAGSMGVVVEAWHIELDQRVAIKFLYPEFASNREGAERFRREARASARIESEHVAKVLDIGTMDEGRTLYYVMEFLRGHDLSRELALHGSVPVRTAVDHVLETCEALAEAHAKGIVHRDLKPANLFLVERTGTDRMIKVVDFGISKITGGTTRQFSLTDTSIMMGSPAYMSPEQLESSRNVDGRADIWSLGVILHELILGQIPFQGESVPQLVRSILLGKRVPLTSRAGVSAELEAVVERCLRQNRDERFGSITELREALIPFSTLGRRQVPPSVIPSRVAVVGGSPTRATPPPAFVPTSPSAAAASLGAAEPAPMPVTSVMGSLDGAPEAGGGVAPEAPETAGLQSASAPTSWGQTQRGQSWRETMYRRGLPAALLATLALSGVYWVLKTPATPRAAASNAIEPTDHPAIAQTQAVAKPVAVEPAIQPVEDKPRAEPEPESAHPAAESSPAVHPAPEVVPTQRVGTNAIGLPAPKPPPLPASVPGSARKSAGSSGAVSQSGGQERAPTPGSSSPDKAGELRANKLPNFMLRLDGQDYGGRE